jgi:hypothetical protein
MHLLIVRIEVPNLVTTDDFIRVLQITDWNPAFTQLDEVRGIRGEYLLVSKTLPILGTSYYFCA